MVIAVRKRVLDAFDATVVALVLVYYGPLVAVAHISNYGFRMLAPGVPLLLYLSFRGVELLRKDRESPVAVAGGSYRRRATKPHDRSQRRITTLPK
jgi:hypothetical protein